MRLFPDRIPPLRRIQLDLTQKSHLILIKPHSITIQFELNLGFPSQPTNQPTNQPITNPPTNQPTQLQRACDLSGLRMTRSLCRIKMPDSGENVGQNARQHVRMSDKMPRFLRPDAQQRQNICHITVQMEWGDMCLIECQIECQITVREGMWEGNGER